MTATTPKYALPYNVGTDPVATADDTMAALAARVDYLLGEAGTFTFGAVAGTQTQAIDLSRAYPGGFKVFVSAVTGVVAGSISVWGTTELATGGAGGVGRFTLGVNRPGATATTVNWRVVPLP